MSHNVTLAGVKITDLDMLSQIVDEKSEGRARLDKDAKTFRTYLGQPNKCDAAVIMPGVHDVGLIADKDGAYVPVFDPYAMDQIFKSPFGTNYFGTVVQEYLLQQAEYEAAQNGFSTKRTAGERGVVTLELVAAS